MNISFNDLCLEKNLTHRQSVFVDLKRIEIISQHTLNKAQAYAEWVENKKITNRFGVQNKNMSHLNEVIR